MTPKADLNDSWIVVPRMGFTVRVEVRTDRSYWLDSATTSGLRNPTRRARAEARGRWSSAEAGSVTGGGTFGAALEAAIKEAAAAVVAAVVKAGPAPKGPRRESRKKAKPPQG